MKRKSNNVNDLRNRHQSINLNKKYRHNSDNKSKKYNQSDPSESDDESQNNNDYYEDDGFLVADNAEEEEGSDQNHNHPNHNYNYLDREGVQVDEPILENELGSSDLEILDEQGDIPRKKVKKKLKKLKKFNREEYNRMSNEYGNEYEYGYDENNLNKNNNNSLKNQSYQSNRNNLNNTSFNRPKKNYLRDENSENSDESFIEYENVKQRNRDREDEELSEDDNYNYNDYSNKNSHQNRINHSIAHDIFEKEFSQRNNKNNLKERKNGKPEFKINSLYENEEIEEEFVTERDKIILKTDIPERMQLKYTLENLQKQKLDIDLESEYILDRLKQLKPNDNKALLKKKIALVLELYKRDLYDIPYIAYYKRIVFETELNQNDIWRIFELDKEWLKLNEYKQKVRRHYQGIEQYLDADKYTSIEKTFITNTLSIIELKDVEIFINFIKEIFNDELRTQQLNKDNNIKLKPLKNSFVRNFKNFHPKIIEFGQAFTLSSYELSQNLDIFNSFDDIKKEYKVNPNSVVNTSYNPKEKPSIKAFDYINSTYTQEIDVLKVVCKFLATELSMHPHIRGFVRKHFFSSAKISTEPTEKGINELDVFNQYFKVKRLIGKPIEEFNDDIFIYIEQAEKDGLIKVVIDVDPNQISKIINTVKQSYINYNANNDDLIVRDWNVVREEIIRILINDLILPDFKKEAKLELFERAELFVINECSKKFYSQIITGPYKKVEIEKKLEDIEIDFLKRNENTVKVLSIVYDHVEKKTYSVILDEDGEILDTNCFNYFYVNERRCTRECILSRPIENNNIEKKRLPCEKCNLHEKAGYNEEKIIIKQIIDKYQPNLCLIGASHLQCRFFKDKIDKIFSEGNLLPKSESDGDAWITFGDLSIPKLISNSSFANRHLANYNNFYRQAISLGRLKQNPLTEILLLWNENVSKNMILNLDLHTMQKVINQNKLSEALEIEAIKVSNMVGVDINNIYEHPHLTSSLSFISGLGPRKAKYLLSLTSYYGGLSMRFQLLATKLLEKNIFLNCIGFIRIKLKNIEHISTDNYDLLDTTRIHPEVYPMAKKLAKSAVEIDDEEDNNYNKNKKKKKIEIDNVEDILKHPKKLQYLDINDYIRTIEEKGNSNIRLLFNFIISEFTFPFNDPRIHHKEHSPEEIFYLMINETKETFAPGHIVLATVIKCSEQHVTCKLQNDVEATVWCKDIVEDNEQPTDNVFKNYYEGLVFQARIKSINVMKFKVDLSTRISELKNNKLWLNTNLDKNFQVVEKEDTVNRLFIEDRKKENKKYNTRNIKHSSFKNCTYLTSVEYLSERNIGDYLFRPSSKGLDHITLSWKFYNHVYSHIDILERDRPKGGFIGSKLIINGEIYYSLQEIVERYIKICDKYVREVVAHRKFVHCDNFVEIENYLNTEKHNNPSIIHYCFTILPEYPQYIILGSIPKQTIIKEFLKIKPSGFNFHNKYFGNVEALLQWFKSNYSKDDYKNYIRYIQNPVLETRNNSNKYGKIEQGQSIIGGNENDNNYGGSSGNGISYNDKLYLNHKRDRNANSTYNGGGNTGNYTNTNGNTGIYNGGYSSRKNYESVKKGDSDWGENNNVNNDGWGSNTNTGGPNSNSDGWGGTSVGNNNNKTISNTGNLNINSGNNNSNINNNSINTDSVWNMNNTNDNSVIQNKSEFYQKSNSKSENKSNYSGSNPNRRNTSCYNCKEEGHISRDCPQSPKKGNNKCYNCQEEGHKSYECPKKKGDRGGEYSRGDRNSKDYSSNNNNNNNNNDGWGSNNKTYKNSNNSNDDGWGSNKITNTNINTKDDGWGNTSPNTNITSTNIKNTNSNDDGWGNTSPNTNTNNTNPNDNNASGW